MKSSSRSRSLTTANDNIQQPLMSVNGVVNNKTDGNIGNLIPVPVHQTAFSKSAPSNHFIDEDSNLLLPSSLALSRDVYLEKLTSMRQQPYPTISEKFALDEELGGEDFLVESQKKDKKLNVYESSLSSLHMNQNINMLRRKGNPAKLVSGSQFRLVSKEIHRCENCDELERLLKKAKETIRSLKLQISRLEDNYFGLKKSKHIDIPIGHHLSSTSDHVNNVFHEVSTAKELLQKKSDDLEIEISRLRKTIYKDKASYEDLQRSYHQINIDSNNSKLAHEKEMNDINNERKKYEELSESLKLRVSQVQEQLESSENKLTLSIKELTAKKSPDFSSEVERLRKDNLNMLANAKSLNDIITRNVVTARELEKKNVGLEDSCVELNELITQKSSALAAALSDLDAFMRENEKLRQLKEACDVDKLSLEGELDRIRRESETLSGENEGFKSEIDRLNVKIAELWKKMLSESESTKKALELAISGSMRLCVVAPTVNVHVSDRKLKFKGALSEKALRDFLTNVVLSKYSFLFQQREEDAAPDGSSLQSWIQKMLADMQSSIEQHVNSAMDGSN